MKDNKSEVTIVPNKMGAKIRVSANNADYAHVLLKQEKTIISTTGWVKPIKVHALLHGKLEDIQDIGIADTVTLPGQIVVREQLVPFSTSNPERDYKYAGKTGIVCCKDGEPIYRQCFYDATMMMSDELISHTNGDDIKIANTSDEDTKHALKAEQSFLKEYFPGDQVDLEDSIAQVEAEAEDKMTPLEQELDELLDKSSVEEREILETPESNPFDDTDDEEADVMEEDNGVEVEDNVEVEVEEDTFTL